MKPIIRWSLSSAAVAMMMTGTALAQDVEVVKKVFNENVQIELAQAVGGSISFEAKVVKGAPYSATAESETIQLLTDGNRIRNKTTTMVYRDGEGRTRREMMGNTPGVPSQVFINDPISNAAYSLNTKQHTATKSQNMATFTVVTKAMGEEAKAKNLDTTVTVNVSPSKAGQATEVERVVVEEKLRRARVEAGGVGQGVGIAERTEAPAQMIFRAEKPAAKESLGQQMIEGIMCEGSRRTFSIAAGSIGNELPINIVTEEWYSPELQALVLTKRTDPRNGETIYRLTNINRSEPSKDLFVIPADYTVQEATRPTMMRRVKEEQ